MLRARAGQSGSRKAGIRGDLDECECFESGHRHARACPCRAGVLNAEPGGGRAAVPCSGAAVAPMAGFRRGATAPLGMDPAPITLTGRTIPSQRYRVSFL